MRPSPRRGRGGERCAKPACSTLSLQWVSSAGFQLKHTDDEQEGSGSSRPVATDPSRQKPCQEKPLMIPLPPPPPAPSSPQQPHLPSSLRRLPLPSLQKQPRPRPFSQQQRPHPPSSWQMLPFRKLRKRPSLPQSAGQGLPSEPDAIRCGHMLKQTSQISVSGVCADSFGFLDVCKNQGGLTSFATFSACCVAA